MGNSLLLKRSSPFAFPGGAPGFDSSHPAAQSISIGHGFSGIAKNGGFVNLLSGTRGVNSNGPTSALIGTIGPSLDYSGSTMSTAFAGQSSVVDGVATIAGIFQLDSIGLAVQSIFCSSSASSTGVLLSINSTGLLTISVPGRNGSLNTTPLLSAGVPYFVAASMVAVTGGAANIVVVNLATGQVQSVVTTMNTLASLPAPNGTYFVGQRGAGSSALIGKLATVMFAPQFTSMAQLMAWAADPWSFWYPAKVYLSSLLNVPGISLTPSVNLYDQLKPFWPTTYYSLSSGLNPNLFAPLNPIPFNQTNWSKPLSVALAPINLSFSQSQLLTNPYPIVNVQSFYTHSPTFPLLDQPYNLNLYGLIPSNPIVATDTFTTFKAKNFASPDYIYNPNLYTNPIPFNQTDFQPTHFAPQARFDLSIPTNLNIFTNLRPLLIFAYPSIHSPLPVPPDYSIGFQIQNVPVVISTLIQRTLTGVGL